MAHRVQCKSPRLCPPDRVKGGRNRVMNWLVRLAQRSFQRVKTVSRFLTAARKLIRHEEGATMVEYGLMLALIAVVCLVAVTAVGTAASTLYNNVSATL